MVEVVHKGFDALDIAFNGYIPEKLSNLLAEKKAEAQENGLPTIISVNGVKMRVFSSVGRGGGYAFRCSTGNTGEIWWFKRPNNKTDWGIFVSVSAIRLACHGLERVRQHLLERLEAFGINYRPGTERINRIDFAVDLLMPEFVLDKDRFVVGHRAATERGYVTPFSNDTASSRTTGLTFGKMPGRQVCIYDKRLQIMQVAGKKFWLDVWNRTRAANDKEPLDITDRTTSRVWRVELRLGSRALKKKRYSISGFGTLQKKINFMLRELLRDIRMVRPTGDSNRSRWPWDPLWVQIKEEVRAELFKQRADLPLEYIADLQRNTKAEMLQKQIAGCIITLAGLFETKPEQLPSFVVSTLTNVQERYDDDPIRTRKKLKEAIERASAVQPPEPEMKEKHDAT